MPHTEIVARRRKWSAEEKAALLAEVEAEGGRISVVARRHGISNSLIYNWRAAWKAAVSMRPVGAVEFMPIGVLGQAVDEALPRSGAQQGRSGLIEIELANGIRLRVDALVNEQALSRVLRVMKASV
jgi:transposase